MYNDIIDEGIKRDEKLIETFHTIADGKFYGQGLSEHFGFRFWNDSNTQFPTRQYVYPSRKNRMLISKKDETWYHDGQPYTQLSEDIYDFMRYDLKEVIIEISCGSRESIRYTVQKDCDWLELSKEGGETLYTDELKVSIDRAKLSKSGEGVRKGTVTITDSFENAFSMNFYADADELPKAEVSPAFYESTGYIAFEADGFFNRHDTKDAAFKVLKPYGITGSAVKMYPNLLDLTLDTSAEKPYLEYAFYCCDEDDYIAEFTFAPSLPVRDISEQCFGYSINASEMESVNTVIDTKRPIFNSPQWAEEAKCAAKRTKVNMHCHKGFNTLRYYQLSPNLILERVVLQNPRYELPKSYLGPSTSFGI